MMKLLTAATIFLMSVVLKMASNPSSSWPSGGYNTTDVATSIPGFVDLARVYDSRNFSTVGYTAVRSLRSVLGKTALDATEEVNTKLNRVEFKASSVCRAQHAFAVEILRSVETIWNTTMDRSPYNDRDFSYGRFLEEEIPQIPRPLLHLEKVAEAIGHDLNDLGDRIASLVTSVSDEALFRSPAEHYLFGEALVQFISSVLFVGNISLSVSAVQAYLLEIGMLTPVLEEGDGSVELTLELLERLYETGLALIIPADLLENVCVDVLL